MNENDIFKLVGYVIASEYRTNIIKCIGNDIKIPSVIAEEVGLRTNHVSNVLKELKSSLNPLSMIYLNVGNTLNFANNWQIKPER